MCQKPDYCCPICAIFVMCVMFLLPMTAKTSKCIFDEVQPTSVRSAFVRYETSTKPSANQNRTKRSITELYQPIRIKVEFYGLEKSLNALQQENLKDVVMETIEKVKRIFKVVPVKGPLLLTRSFSEACKNKIVSGINAGKCHTFKASYDGEYCLDWFKIPDEHLEGFYLYNLTSPIPFKEVFPTGAGLTNTDYILYVSALTSETCINQGKSTIAYAGYCQLDQNDRPVAGYINFCPWFIKDDTYNRDKASLTALHEIFHALGFASDLFPKYKDCQPTDAGVSCTTRHSPIREVFGVQRLVLPCVVNLTSEHFNCSSHPTENEYGPVLQIENGKPGSHWDTAFMYGSLMTPNIGLPHLTILDSITLATFEDSGWYKVNYDYAEMFTWGKNGGCQFGTTEGCQQMSSPYYCTGSSQGCHFLHYDKAVCGTDSFLHGCRVFKSKPEDSCLDPDNSPTDDQVQYSGEVYGEDSRCFVANLTKLDKLNPSIETVPGGRCYQTLCNNTELFIQVHGGPYYPCPWGQTTQIPGYGGIVECPDQKIICQDTRVTYTAVPEATPGVTESYPVITDTRGKVCIDLYYGQTTYGLIHLDSRLFQRCNLDTIVKTTGVNRHRLENYYIIEGSRNSAVFRFNLLPATYYDQGPPSEEAIASLRNVVQAGNFTFVIPQTGQRFTAFNIVVTDLGPRAVNQKMPDYVIGGIVIGAAGGVIIVVLFILYLQKRSAGHQSYNSNGGNMATIETRLNQLAHEAQLTQADRHPRRSHPRSHRANARLRSWHSQSEPESSSVGSRSQHSRQNSQSSPFYSPSSAQTFHTPADLQHNSLEHEMYPCDNTDYIELEIDDTTHGHVNVAYQSNEQPATDMEPVNFTDDAVV